MRYIRSLIIFAVTLSLGVFLAYILKPASGARDEKLRVELRQVERELSELESAPAVSDKRLLSKLLKIEWHFSAAFFAGDKEILKELLADEYVMHYEGRKIASKDRLLEMVVPVRRTAPIPPQLNPELLHSTGDSASISYETLSPDRKIHVVDFVWRDGRWQMSSSTADKPQPIEFSQF